MSLSERIRAGSEAAPWVVKEVEKLENEMRKLRERNRELETQMEYQTGIGKMMKLHLNLNNNDTELYSNEYDLHPAFNLPSEL